MPEHDSSPAHVGQPTAGTVASRFLQELRDAPLRTRFFLVLYLAVGAWGGLSGGIALSREFPNVWVITGSLLILEPIGLACLAALVVIVAPESPFSDLLQGALARAKLALWLVLVGVAGLVLFLFGFVLHEWWGLRR